VIAARDASATIGAALESVAGQSCRPCEIIVVDDGSTDGTADLVERQHSAVHVVRQANAGPSSARNRGLALAKGRLVGFLDADDLWPPGALESLREPFAGRPDAAAVQGCVADLWAEREGDPSAAPRRALNVGAALFRREALLAVGGFDAALRSGEDFDLWLRLRERNLPVLAIPAVALWYRRKPSEGEAGQRRAQAGRLRALRRSLERGRGV
jgi:glycosyltransferase involved in cell wall biosynthesis